MTTPQFVSSRPHDDLEAEPTQTDLQPWGRGWQDAIDDDDDALTIIRERPSELELAPIVALVRRRAPVEILAPARGPEPVEQLPLPPGFREDALRVGERPRDPVQTRVAIVRVVRELGADYRRWYGVALRTGAAAVEAMQRHLLARAGEVAAGSADAGTLASEVVRHGALLGEIVARRAGGVWVDLAGVQPAAWHMGVPSGQVFGPVARVQRFLIQRSKEEDLVPFYLRLEAATTGAS